MLAQFERNISANNILGTAMSSKWADVQTVTIEILDEIIEADGELSCIRQLPMDASDAARTIQYLEAVANTTPQNEHRIELEDICYDLAVSHGDLCCALRLALNRADHQRVAELYKITLAVENKPPPTRLTKVIPAPNGWWSSAARVSYDIDCSDKDKYETECQLRRAMRVQLAHQISRHVLNFPLTKYLAEPESAEMADSTAGPERSAADQQDEAMEGHGVGEADEDVTAVYVERVLRGEHIPELFSYLARELDVMEVRKPESIFKTDFEDGRNRRSLRGAGGGLESSRLALASAYVSGFVHAGFKMDGLLIPDESSYIHKARANGITGATAAIGLISMWDVEEGLSLIDKFQYSSESYTKAGAYLAFGINSANVSHECDPILTLVPDGLNSDKVGERLAAIFALGYAYAGTAKEEVSCLLVPIVLDLETVGGLEVSSAAALALGLVFVGTAEESVAEGIAQTMIERAELQAGIDTTHAFNLGLGFALLFAECRDAVLPALASLEAVNHTIGDFTRLLTEACAYAGTGDVVKTQEMIHVCIKKVDELLNSDEEPEVPANDPEESPQPAEPTSAEKPDTNDNVPSSETDQTSTKPLNTTQTETNEENSAAAQTNIAESVNTAAPVEGKNPTEGDAVVSEAAAPSPTANAAAAAAKLVRDEFRSMLPGVAVFALALISLKNEIASEMLLRMLSHFLQFDGLHVRRAIPVALMMHSASNPKPAVVDMLSKLSHDPDADTALHAIVALGVVAAGTNNSKVAQLLRQLAAFYSNDSNALFLVRLSQGLLYCGKGLVSISPLHSDRSCLHRTSLASLTAFCTQALFTKDTLCSARYHLNMYHLVPAIHPRWLLTLDENQNPVQVQVRVGQAVDTAGLAGEPKRMTGYRTHNTPILLAFDEKAQIGSDEWQALTDICEGVVIVRKLQGKEKALAARALE